MEDETDVITHKANGEWFANLLGPNSQTGVNRMLGFILVFVLLLGLIFFMALT